MSRNCERVVFLWHKRGGTGCGLGSSRVGIDVRRGSVYTGRTKSIGTSLRTFLLIIIVTTLSISAPALAGGELVIKKTASGQLSKRLSTLQEPLGGKLQLQAISIKQETIEVRFGVEAQSPTLFHVSLVHPSRASAQAVILPGVAINPVPGPVIADMMKALEARLKQPFEPPLWSETSTMERRTPPVQAGPANLDKKKPTAESRTEAIPLRKILQLLQMGDDADALKLLDETRARPNLKSHDRAEIAVLYVKLNKKDVAAELVRGLTRAPLNYIAAVVRGETPDPVTVVQSVGDKNACQAVMVANAYMTLGRTSDAETLLGAVREKDSNCIKGHLSLGQLYLNEKRAKEAIRLLTPARAANPEDSSLTLMLAHAHRHLGELDQAVRLVEEAVHNGKGRDDHVRLLITMYLQQQEERERIDEWRERSKTMPNDPIPKMMVGILLHYRDEFEESEAWLKPVEDVFSFNPRYQVYRAMNAYNLGDAQLARDILDRAANFKVIDPDVFYCRGELLRDTERTLAIADFKRYLALTKDSPINLPEKQERVETQIRLLEECQANNTEVCDGPWEHPRGGIMRFLALHMREVYTAMAGLVVFFGFWFYRRRKKQTVAPDA